MSAQSKIEWTEASWNPIRARMHRKTGWHCEKISAACANCYAEAMNMRLGNGVAYRDSHIKRDIFLDEKMLLQPLRWKRPRRIFVCSMTDLFGEWVPDAWLDKIFAVMAVCPQHTFQVLTKRPERMRDYCSNIQKHGRWLAMEDFALELGKEPRGADNDGFDWLANQQFLPNVWLGVTAENQETADKRIPLLLGTPAALRWVSVEPMLGPIDLFNMDCLAWGAMLSPKEDPRLDWVVAGGESGPHARPSHPDWFRSLRDQCAAAGVPFLFKQWGEWTDADAKGVDMLGTVNSPLHIWEDRSQRTHVQTVSVRVGKKAAGRLLDGVLHDGYPEVRS